jgi:hypothetical protein
VATPSLRPMRIGEILDAAIKLCLRNWKVLGLTVFGIVVPLVVIDVLVTASVDPNQLRFNGSQTTSDTSDAAAGGAAVARLLIGLTIDVCVLACFKAVSDAWLGEKPSVSDSLRRGLRRLVPFIGLGLLVGLMALVVILVIALIVAVLGLFGIVFIVGAVLGVFWFMPIFAVAHAVLVLEGIGPIRSLRRAGELVRGRWWATAFTFFVAAVLMIVLFFIFAFIVGLVFGVSGNDESDLALAIALVVIYVVAFSLSIPFGTAVTTLVYYDRRVRKEGLDLQLAGDAWPSEDDTLGEEPERTGWDRPAEPSAPASGSWPPPEAPRGPGGL